MKTFTAKVGDYVDEVRVFTTNRLVVSWHEIPETDDCDSRWFFAARLRSEDVPRVVAHATVWAVGNFLEWIEVDAQHRRKGIGTEFRNVIESAINAELESCPATDEGQAFRASLGIVDEN